MMTETRGTILVVEDEPALRGQLVDALRRAGHTVEAAADGPEGLFALGLDTRLDALIDAGSAPAMMPTSIP